ncbi:MAG: hypothetical protein GEV11_28610 [Streptosporangiales bacterium]|nr:hypothetical protein [Streptosporangiales bacterium]
MILAATDGATLPTNPGPAAWAFVLDDDGTPGVPVSGAIGWGTNQIAELTAVREVLKATTGPIEIRSDSLYAIKCLTIWHHRWRVNGWLNAKKRPVENRALIEEILGLLGGRDVRFVHVKAHQVGGDPYNAVADRAANAAARACRATRPPEPPFGELDLGLR